MSNINFEDESLEVKKQKEKRTENFSKLDKQAASYFKKFNDIMSVAAPIKEELIIGEKVRVTKYCKLGCCMNLDITGFIEKISKTESSYHGLNMDALVLELKTKKGLESVVLFNNSKIEREDCTITLVNGKMVFL